MELVEIGQVAKPRGLKGEIKLISFLSDNKDFLNVKIVYIDENKFEVEKWNVADDVYLKLKEISSIDDAEKFRNKILKCEKKFIKKDDEFLIGEIIGLRVVCESGDVIGELVDVEQFGAADVFCVKESETVYRIPNVSGLIIEINLVKKVIIVNKKYYDEVKVCD